MSRVSAASATLGLIDQSIVSGGAFGMALISAHYLPPRDFGLLSITYTLIYFANNIQFGLIGQPHNVVGARLTRDEYARYTLANAIAQIAFSGLSAVLALVAGTILVLSKSELGSVALALAAALVGFQAQEFVRRVFYTERRTGHAALVDATSYSTQIGAVLALGMAGYLSVECALLVSGAAGMVAAATGLAIGGSRALTPIDIKLLKRNWTLGQWLAAAEVAYWATTPIYLYLLATSIGPAAAGELRAAQLMFGPVTVVVGFLNSYLPGHLASQDPLAPGDARDEIARLYGTLLAFSISYGAVMLVASSTLVTFMFGGEYSSVPTLSRELIPYSILLVLTPLATAPLRAKQQSKALFVAYLSAATAGVALAAATLPRSGLVAAVVGLTTTALLTNVICSLLVRRNDIGKLADPNPRNPA